MKDSIRVSGGKQVFHVSLEFQLAESDDDDGPGRICNVWVGSTVVASIRVIRSPFGHSVVRAVVESPAYHPNPGFDVSLCEEERP